MQGLRVENSPKFQIVLDKCQDIHVQFLSFKSPADNPNTDGIHVENSKNIEIYHSTISIGIYMIFYTNLWNYLSLTYII